MAFGGSLNPSTWGSSSVGVVGALVGGGSAGLLGYGFSKQREAEVAQDRANRTRRRVQRYQAARERRKQIMEAYRARALLVNRAAATGTATGSSFMTGSAQPLNQAAGNIGNINTMEQYNRTISLFESEAASATARANQVNQITGLAMNAGSLFV